MRRWFGLDELAQEGIEFNHAFCVNAMCSPCRASRLEIGDWRLEIGDCRLEIADCRLEIADWGLEIGDWGLEIGDWEFDI